MAKTTQDDPQAFLDPLHSLGYLTRINFRAASRALEQLTLPHGVSAGQWRLLRVLWARDNITQRQLADETGLTEGTTTLAVRSLVNAGLARRVRSTEDKRKSYVRLTAKAKRLQAKLIPMVIEVNNIAGQGIDPEELAITRRVLAQTYANLCKHLEDHHA
ncbi:MAG: MarR family winged helix-turn-helix transcriptional regulator [Pseudomonadales bacterium]